MILKISVAILAIGLIVATPIKEDPKVGCVKCKATDKNKINVHIVPHSHDDVGWLKTVDQYYYGLKNDITKASVHIIITSVIEALAENPDRRFIQVETAFFWKWWKSQPQNMRDLFKSLVDNGQIEMVNGAWSMNDEACTNYQSTIDEFTWGLRTLEDILGECGRPRVGWQIDPFGHSREQASIVAQLGFDGVFFSRMDHDDKTTREKNRSLDFAWQGSTNIADSVIFASAFPTRMYYPPDGFCFDYTCSDEAIDDNKDSLTYNLDTKKDEFRKIIKEYAAFSTSNNILIPMGGDFQYQAAQSNFINSDILIKSFEGDSELNVFYSTPSCYIQAVNNADVQLSLKTDDFFPYSEKNDSFWAGYFTSRPTIKRFERTGNNILQVSKQLVSLYQINSPESSDISGSLTDLRETMGIMQHHDAITGTEKEAVASDYARLLTRAIERAEEPLSPIINFLLTKDRSKVNQTELNFSSCPLSNITICETSSKSETFVVAVYNPLAWTTTHYVRLPISYVGNYEINGPDGPVKYQQVPSYLEDFDFSPFGTTSSYELLFAAKDLPPLGLRLYHITQKRAMNDVHMGHQVTNGGNRPFEVDPKTNLLSSVNLNGISLNVTQNFYSYASYGASGEGEVNSGAYVFRPANQFANLIEGTVRGTEFRGDVVYEFHQRWKTDFAKLAQAIRYYPDEDYVEMDWAIGDLNQSTGQEVITRFTIPNLVNNGVFYTDSNGRETLKRTLNVHPGYVYDYSQEPVSSNYYPVTAALAIKDKEVGVAILNDRSQGGSSLKDGELELMIHRRLLYDDGKGVEEALNEIEMGYGITVRGSHYIVVGSTKNESEEASFIRRARKLAQRKLNQPWIGQAPTTISYSELKDQYKMEYSALEKPLPDNVNILTFEPWRNGTFLLRLENIYEKEEAIEQSVELDLENIFKDFEVVVSEERTLGANENLEKFENRTKYTWKLDRDPLPTATPVKDNGGMKKSLTPMQIRTFEVTFGGRKPISGSMRISSSLSSMILFVITVYYAFY